MLMNNVVKVFKFAFFRYLTEQEITEHITNIEYIGRTTDTLGALVVRFP